MSNQVQVDRCRKLFASVVMAALDEAIDDGRRRKYDGPASIRTWARSRDGQEVLQNAGIEPSEEVVQGLGNFVARGVKTSVAMAKGWKGDD